MVKLNNTFIRQCFFYIKILECVSLPRIKNGKLTLKKAGQTQIGATAVVSCDKGYNKTISIITCLDTGHWQNASCNIVGKI